MPPKAAVTPSKSRSLVPVGPRTVATKRKNHGIRDENGERPTTTRALVLRNGKHGARGTGEMILVTKLSGREKLDLLAEDLTERSKTAIMAPFRLQECLKIAESQCEAFLDDITNLRDPQLFMHLIQIELNARTKKDKTESDPLKNASYVASVVATRIHNAFMLAAAWKLVSQTLAQLALDGVTDASIKTQIKNNAGIRTRYLVLYDLMNDLIGLSQSKFSVLATTTPHYARYFKAASDKPDAPEPEIIFDWQELREACVSFLDSIIIELCFPQAPYPKDILYQILHDAVEEAPKEAKRFPQELWDAVGDLSISIQLQQMLEAPLSGPEGTAWKAERQTGSRQMPADYDVWEEAQVCSQKAAGMYANYKDSIFPLEKTKTKVALDHMWKFVNINYKAVSGVDIDTLWGLNAELNPTPQWHAFYRPGHEESDDEDDSKPSLAGFKGKKKVVKRLAITSGPADSDDSMPELQSVSNSSDEIDSDSDEDSDEDDDEESDSDESDYDTEEEDEMREMLREAMDTASEADWLHSNVDTPEMDPFTQDDRKGNPFLKLLGSLRGRMFSSSPKLKTTTRTEPLKDKLGRTFGKTPAPSKAPPTAAPKPTPVEIKSHKPTVEDVEDEGEVSQVKKKKKKKKPKKKKKNTATAADDQDGDEDVAESPLITSPPTSSAKVPVAVAPKATPASPVKKVVVPPKVVSDAKAPSLFGSTTSLLLPSETVAQSARSYIQAENLDAQKSKIKSRPNHATVFSTPKKSSIFSKFFSRAKGEFEEKPQKGAKHSWFSKLSKKSKGLMHQLLNTAEDETKGIAPMKWDNFVKLMREMGFDYDPSTAGSSVRFDPPDKRDQSITFHKPHPDPTLHPTMLKDYAKRLKRHYGWTEEDFIRQTEAYS